MQRRDSLKAMLGGLAAVFGFSGCGPEEVPGLPPTEPPDEPRVEALFDGVKLCRFRVVRWHPKARDIKDDCYVDSFSDESGYIAADIGDGCGWAIKDPYGRFKELAVEGNMGLAIQDSQGGWVVWQMDDPRKTTDSADSAV